MRTIIGRRAASSDLRLRGITPSAPRRCCTLIQAIQYSVLLARCARGRVIVAARAIARPTVSASAPWRGWGGVPLGRSGAAVRLRSAFSHSDGVRPGVPVLVRAASLALVLVPTVVCLGRERSL